MLVSGNLFVVLLSYLTPIVILVVFGIWGFRLGSKGSNGNPPGGGLRKPRPVPPPPGGEEEPEPHILVHLHAGASAGSRGAVEDAPERERELVAPGR